ncbi:GNAT family N-acetyltransferase [Stutzerimonas zhaodongensis]|uniref:GNAT family N-acetyltransferase n=1 Tax=Stutzerimonas TaxID=2901164 RepID=UPI00388D100F
MHFFFNAHAGRRATTATFRTCLSTKDLRDAGVGRMLIEHVHTAALAAGASRVHWLTQEHNITARQLYDRIAERTGFVQYRKLL